MSLDFATNVINSTTLSVLTPGIRILYFYILYFLRFLSLKMTRRKSKRSKFNVMIIVN